METAAARDLDAMVMANPREEIRKRINNNNIFYLMSYSVLY